MERRLTGSEASDDEASRSTVSTNGTKKRRRREISSERESIEDPDFQPSFSGRVLRSRKRKPQVNFKKANVHF